MTLQTSLAAEASEQIESAMTGLPSFGYTERQCPDTEGKKKGKIRPTATVPGREKVTCPPPRPERHAAKSQEHVESKASADSGVRGLERLPSCNAPDGSEVAVAGTGGSASLSA